MNTVPIQCYPFVFGNDGTGGLEGNAKLLASINNSVVNMTLTNYEITLDDDYKAIVAILFSEFTSGYPTVTLTLENGTYKSQFIKDGYKTFMSGFIGFDLNVQKKKDEKYIVKYRSWYSSSTSPPYWLKVYGIK